MSSASIVFSFQFNEIVIPQICHSSEGWNNNLGVSHWRRSHERKWIVTRNDR